MPVSGSVSGANPAERYLSAGAGEDRYELSILLALFLFSLLLLSAYLVVANRTSFTTGANNFFLELGKSKSKTFRIGHASLGANLDVFRNNRPDAVIAVSANGIISARYAEDGATIGALYANDGKNRVSYQVRYDNTFFNTDEEAVISEISTRFGAPSTSSCNARVTDGVIACRFSWWLPNEVKLELATRKPTDGGAEKEDSLAVTLIAVDEHLKRRLARNPLAPSSGLMGSMIMR